MVVQDALSQIKLTLWATTILYTPRAISSFINWPLPQVEVSRLELRSVVSSLYPQWAERQFQELIGYPGGHWSVAM